MNKKKLNPPVGGLKLNNPFVKKETLWQKLSHQSRLRYALLVSVVLVFLVFMGLVLRPILAKPAHYDPVVLLKEIKEKKEVVRLVDLRPKKAYQKGHIRGAINLPWEGDQVRWLKIFKQQKLKAPVVLYEYSQSSVAPRELSFNLSKRGLKAAALTIGWNEWRHFHANWLPESEWGNFDLELFVEPRP